MNNFMRLARLLIYTNDLSFHNVAVKTQKVHATVIFLFIFI